MKKRETQFIENCLEGRYANYFKIGHNADVFVIDYFQYFPVDREKLNENKLSNTPRVRIITAPADAKQLFEDLKDSIEDFEKANGVIGKPTDS